MALFSKDVSRERPVLCWSKVLFIILITLKSSLQKFYGRHHELVDRYGVSICTIKTDLFNVSVFLSSFVYLGLDFLWATSRVFLEKQRTLTLPVYLTHAPSFLFESELHLLLKLCMYYFNYYLFFVVSVCFPCLVFVPGLYSSDFC